MSKNATRIDDPNHSGFKLEVFKEKLSEIQNDYHIRILSKGNPNPRAAKRIVILVSEAFLVVGGDVHYCQNLEAEIYKLCKEYFLDCDELEIESADKSYICRRKGKKGKPHKDCGKKFCATQFDNHLINETNVARENIPLARAIVHYFAYHYFKKEGNKNGTRDRRGKRFNRNLRSKQGSHVSVKKKRTSIYKYQQKSQNLSGQRPNEIL
jgi:hypothetical protein